MGQTCSPGQKKGEVIEKPSDMDAKAVTKEATDATAEDNRPADEKISQLVNFHVAENERLKKEIAELKEADTQRTDDYTDAATKNEKMMKELQRLRAMMEKKHSQVAQADLKTALWARHTDMLARDKARSASARTLISGTLQKFGKAGKGSPKQKWVEVQLHKAEHTQAGFVPGLVRLNYADGKESASFSTGRVVKVQEAKGLASKYQDLCFSVVIKIEEQEKVLVFLCASPEERETWVNTFKDGFQAIENEVLDMHKTFELQIRFDKPKLGIRVEEKVIQKPLVAQQQEMKEDDPAPAQDEPAPAAPETEGKPDDLPPPAEDAPAEDDIPPPAADDTPAADAPPAAGETAEPAPAAETAAEEAAPAVQEPTAPAAPAPEQEKKEDPPCTLIVTAISDDNIREQGLVEQMSLIKLNGRTLEGMGYLAQLELIGGTKKPFDITFAGPTYLKSAAVHTNAFPEILKELLSDGQNATKDAFSSIIANTKFEQELEQSDNQNNMIRDLLNNQSRLAALLQNLPVQSASL